MHNRLINKKISIFLSSIIIFIFKIYYFFKTLVLFLIKHKNHEKDFLQIRYKLLETISFIYYGLPSDKTFPWIKTETGWFSQLMTNRAYIKNKWYSYRFHQIFFNNKQYIKIGRWGILTLYFDYSFPFIYNMKKVIQSFPDDIRNEYHGDEQMHLKKISFTDKKGNVFFSILKRVTTFQCKSASSFFLMPLYKKNSDLFYYSLYNFSEYTILNLMILTDIIDSVCNGSIFHSKVSKEISDIINKYFHDLNTSDITFADLFFFHCSVKNILIEITKEDVDNFSEFLAKTINKPPFDRFEKNSRVMEIIITCFKYNPLSIFLMIDVFSDQKLFDFQSKDQIGWLFEKQIDDDILFWLANHSYSSIMSQYHHLSNKENPDESVVDKITIFSDRIYLMGHLISSINEEMYHLITESDEDNNLIRINNFRKFSVHFFELLLRDWLLKIHQQHLPTLLLSDNDTICSPEKGQLSDCQIDSIDYEEIECIFDRLIQWSTTNEENSLTKSLLFLFKPLEEIVDKHNVDNINTDHLNMLYKKACGYISLLKQYENQ